jgi:hypothetical protein
MNKRLTNLMAKAYELVRERHNGYFTQELLLQYMAVLVINDCIDNLAWHGYNDAAEQLEYHKSSKFGIK